MSDDVVDLAAAADPAAAFRSAHARGSVLRLPTSGSTSEPRHVLRSTHSWAASFDHVTRLAGITSDSAVHVPGPLSSTMNLFAVVHAGHVGARVVADVGEATHAVLTPARLATALAGGGLSGVTVVAAGDRLTPGLHERAQEAGVTVHHYYGAAELSFVAWGRHSEDLRTFPGVEAEIRGDEIWVRSDYVCLGYDGPPGPLRHDPDGFVTVGDRGRLSDGRLEVSGRPGSVTTSGATVVTADVEGVLAPAARGEVLVLAAPHRHHGSVVAAVLTDPDDHGALVELARTGLAPAARPRLWLVCEALPLTRAGKPDRPALSALVAAGELRRLT